MLVVPNLAIAAGTTDVAAQTSYSGRCAAACVRQTLPPPNEQCFADTGTLPGGGGSLSAGEPGVQVGLDVYAATNLTASALAGGGSTTCSTAQQQVSAFGGLLVAASVRADARADCSGATGSSTISGLVFGGLAIVVTGAANQTVSIPGVATLVINEHVAGSASTELTVNALRLTLATGEQLTLCTANVGVLCSVAATDASWGTLKARYE
jgi:hypothetical protein